MPQILNRLFCYILRTLVRPITWFNGGKGGGKFATWLPKEQTFLVQNYCGNLKFQVNTTYPIEGTIWLSGVYDIRTTRFLQTVIRSDDVVLDIGANCGALTLVAASCLDRGKVYAFEPGNVVKTRLQTSVDLNPQLAEIIEVIPCGLGAKRDQLFYSEDANYRGNAALVKTEGIPVEVITLDEWVAARNIAKINFIKIDVEGMEYEVLLGSKDVLQRDHPIIYFETLPLFFEETTYTIRSLYEFLAQLGYHIVYPEPPYPAIPFEGTYPANSVAIHPQDFARLGLTV
jgi:FkbM family methyltransferase